jgi:hypothetical protein
LSKDYRSQPRWSAGKKVDLRAAVEAHRLAAQRDDVPPPASKVDGVVLFCADRLAPLLLVGQDRALVLLAAAPLGLDIRGHAGTP